METKWIEDFMALSEYQSFSRAAKARNLTQSGFSRRIRALEQWVDADLIDRSSHPPTLTPAGHLFRESAEDILGKLFDTRATIRTEQRMPATGLQIAAGHSIALNFLPAWLSTLAAQFRDVRARVIPTNVDDSILMLANGDCELMFAYHHPALPLHLDPLRYQQLTVGMDTFMPVCRPNQKPAPSLRLPGTSDHPLPLISYTKTGYFGRCLALLLQRAEKQPMLRLHYESDMAEVLKKLVLEGEGIAWLPKSSVQAELTSGELVPAGGKTWQLELELRVYHDSSSRNKFSETLWRYLRSVN